MDAARLDEAFRRLRFMLRANSRIERDHLTWFAAFPFYANYDLSNFPSYRASLLLVTTFLRFFSEGWEELLGNVERRRCPLLVWELKCLLGCQSPILQRILITVSGRRLFPDDKRCAVMLQESIKLDQQNESKVPDTKAAKRKVEATRNDIRKTYVSFATPSTTADTG